MSALLEAMRRVKRQPQLIVFLALVNLLISFAAARPLSAALASALDNRPAASALIRGDDGMWGELMEDRPELAIAATASAQAATLAWGLLSWILAGGILATLALDSRGGVGEMLRASVTSAGRMLWVGALGLLLRLLPLFVAFVLSVALRPLLKGHGFAPMALGSTILLAVTAVVWSMVSVIIDYARALVLATPSLHPLRALGRALRLGWRRLPSTTLVALYSLVAWGAITAVQLALAHALPAEPAWSDLVGLVVRVLAAAGRAAVTTVALVAAGRLATVSGTELPTEAGHFRAEAAPLG